MNDLISSAEQESAELCRCGQRRLRPAGAASCHRAGIAPAAELKNRVETLRAGQFAKGDCIGELTAALIVIQGHPKKSPALRGHSRSLTAPGVGILFRFVNRSKLTKGNEDESDLRKSEA